MRRSKFVVPSRPPSFIERDEVRAALEHHSASPERGPVVLVSAPTGYGKTAAVADWVCATPDVATSWVSLDESERDEIAWWRSVLAALRAGHGVPEDSALHRLEFAFPDRGSWAREAFVATLLEAREGLPGPGCLVRDDALHIGGHPGER